MNLPVTASERKEWNQRRNVREIRGERERERSGSRYNRGFSVRRLEKDFYAITVRGNFELFYTITESFYFIFKNIKIKIVC